ncbi:MAG: hypothetical protein HYY05_01125 [Chloroflexi bacterium]|nr:hypothetical protein [Chloroflexota bacterium]
MGPESPPLPSLEALAEARSRRLGARQPATELEFHAVWVVWLLATAIVAAIAFPLMVLLLSAWPACGVDDHGVAQLLQFWDLAVLKVLLPLTTLILSYLFGSARRRGESG